MQMQILVLVAVKGADGLNVFLNISISYICAIRISTRVFIIMQDLDLYRFFLFELFCLCMIPILW